MYASQLFPVIVPFRAISPVPRLNQRHCLIAVPPVAAPILGGRIAIPLLLLIAALLLVQPSAGESGTWTETGTMDTERKRRTATLLPSGKVLVAGGYTSIGGYFNRTELKDPAAECGQRRAAWEPNAMHDDQRRRGIGERVGRSARPHRFKMTRVATDAVVLQFCQESHL